jgi:putative acetyltransferase
MATAPKITAREFVLADYDGAVALWNEVEGVEICEGDSREEISEYLMRNPKLSRVAEANGKIVGAALCAAKRWESCCWMIASEVCATRA